MDQVGLELGKIKPINGFSRVAAKIAHDIDKTTTIYRRFDQLSARNLLYLQAEIAELESLMRGYDYDDLKARDSVALESHTDWRSFERYGTQTDHEGNFIYPREAKRMRAVLEIREKLKIYRK